MAASGALPLPQDAGDALLAYLERARPPAACDQVFLRSSAPYRPFSGSSVVSGIVRLALTRAGIELLLRRAPIFFAIPQRQPCCAAVQLWTWLAQFCATARPIRPPTTPRSISSRCRRSRSPGRGTRDAEPRSCLYIDLHRSLGFKFRSQRILLQSFVAFAEEHGDKHVRSDRVLGWAAHAPSAPQRCNPPSHRSQVCLGAHAIRCHEIPAADALGRAAFSRRAPYIYTSGEIARLLSAAAALKPAGSIKPLTYATLLGLLAATGMRISEALALQLDDITADGLLVRNSKFHKSRLLPLHETARQALSAYLVARGRPAPRNARFSCPMPARRLPITL